jgi:predicted 2-oxoglutarate/Fe(II)-dependent dioxygenase YbiX
MKFDLLAPGIHLYHDVFPEDMNLANDIEEAVKSGAISWQPAGVYHDDAEGVNKRVRDTDTIGLVYREEIQDDSSAESFIESFNISLSNLLLTFVKPLEDHYALTFRTGTRTHEAYTVLKYGEGQRFLYHIDDHDMYPRRTSYVAYLNDEYTGGEIEFDKFGLRIKPPKNSLIVFPSNYMYSHTVHEVVSGFRYAIVSWSK